MCTESQCARRLSDSMLIIDRFWCLIDYIKSTEKPIQIYKSGKMCVILFCIGVR